MKSMMLVLIGLLALGAGYRSPVEADTTAQRYEAVIDYATVDDDTLELYIEGYVPVDCDLPPNIEWTQRGNTLRAEVFIVTELPCERRRTHFTETVAGFSVLAADLSPGEYRLEVNDYRIWFDVPVAPPPTREPRKRKTPPPPPPPPDERMRVYAVIEDVDATVFESYPARVHLYVRGYHSSGCRSTTYIDQDRVGREIFVDIYRLENPRIMCPAVIEYFDEVIVLEGSFRSGTYTIHVNDFVFVLRI